MSIERNINDAPETSLEKMCDELRSKVLQWKARAGLCVGATGGAIFFAASVSLIPDDAGKMSAIQGAGACGAAALLALTKTREALQEACELRKAINTHADAHPTPETRMTLMFHNLRMDD